MLGLFALTFLLHRAPSCFGNPQYGLCSQVYLMSQYCSNHESTFGENVVKGTEYKVGKAGPAGPRGESGPPGFVNYTEVENRISVSVRDLEEKFNSRLSGYNELLRNTAKLQHSLKKLEEEFSLLSTTGCHDVAIGNAKEATGNGGVFDVYSGYSKLQVFCDLTTENGNWMVFQRRLEGSVDFDRNWSDYVHGFGNLTGEFWLGLEKIYHLTKDSSYELRIDMTDSSDNVHFAKYSTFAVGSEFENYKLTVGGYSGSTTDSLAYHNNMQFSTKDKDHDKWSRNCALALRGGWWFNQCEYSNLNGHYAGAGDRAGGPTGIYWRNLSILKKSEMKFRRKTI